MRCWSCRGAAALAIAAYLVFSTLGAVVAQTSDEEFDIAVSLTKSLLTGGRNREALAQAQRVIRLSPGRFEGHSLAATALLRQNRPVDAEKYAREALRLAPLDRRKDVELLLADVRLQRQVAEKEERAEQARVAGKVFLAATLYLEGFELDPLRVGLGLAGARLWLTLGEPGRAARIYRRLAVGEDSGARSEASRQLATLADPLAAQWSINTTNGWRHFDAALATRPAPPASLDMAIEAFERAIEDYPSAAGPAGTSIGLTESPYIGLAAAQAARGDRQSFEAALTSGAENGLRPDRATFFAADPRSCTIGCKRYDALAPQICRPDLESFLAAVYGPPAVRAARSACNTHTTREGKPRAEQDLEAPDREQARSEPKIVRKKRARAARDRRQEARAMAGTEPVARAITGRRRTSTAR
jgi:tetratricopeptide (TPR) repeat protein